MGVTFSELVPEFRDKCVTLIALLANEGIEVVPYFGIRDAITQAKLWKQSRSYASIARAKGMFDAMGCEYLLDCMNKSKDEMGFRVTGALPGESWHQWGEALDCYVVGKDGKPSWSGIDPKYKRYGEIAKELGLTAGLYFKTPDPGHVQLRAKEVREFYSWHDIDAEMQGRFGSVIL